MKILFLTPRSPYPPRSGGLVKTERLLRHLVESHDVTLAVLKDEGVSIETLKRTIGLNVRLKNILVGASNNRRSAAAFLMSVLMGVPFGVYRNRSKQLKDLIAEHCGDADVIIVDHYLTYQFVPKQFRKKTVYHSHNAEFKIWRSYGEIARNPVKKAVMNFEGARVARYEKGIIRHVAAFLAAPNDLADLAGLGLTRDASWFETYHLSDDKALEDAMPDFQGNNKNVIFVGTLSWEPNADAVIWFAENVWPSVRAKHPDSMFLVVGGGASKSLVDRCSQIPGVSFLGFVDDLCDAYAQASIFVAPMRFGAGIKVKVVDAMYRGFPIVSTNCGVEGIGARSPDEYVVADSALDFELAINRLLTDEALCRNLSRNARAYSAEHLSWHSVLTTFDDAINHAKQTY